MQAWRKTPRTARERIVDREYAILVDADADVSTLAGEPMEFAARRLQLEFDDF